MPIVRTLNQDFFKIWSVEMAYVLGYFAADGSMLQNSRGGCYIEFTSADRILLEHVQSATKSSHSISKRPQRDKKWKELYRLQIGSRTWFEDLTNLGFVQHKSFTLKFPPIPSEYLGHFVRGYFDGDGCVYFQKLKYSDRISKRWILLTMFTSGSLLFLQTLHNKLKELGIRGGSLCRKKRGFELRFSHNDSLALYRVMYHTAQVPNLFLPRKRLKLEEAIQVLKLDKSCGCSSAG